MVGKDCVAIACDLRLGLQALTVSNNFPKIFSYAPSVFLGLTGLATDVQTVSDTFRYKVNMYRLREERNIAPKLWRTSFPPVSTNEDSVPGLSVLSSPESITQRGSLLFVDSIVSDVSTSPRTLL